MSACNICCETFNASTRLRIECEYCKFEACRECCKTYILSETRPHCMNGGCDREWTRQFMQTVFPKCFLAKEYKTHRENILFDQQKALLPATQPLVEQEIQYDKLQVEKENCEKIIRQMQRKIRDIEGEQAVIRHNGRDIKKLKSMFVRACPDEHCKGFLSSQWKCGLCEKWTCSKCHIIKGTSRDCEHECNPDDVATAELLSKDTKPCPTCQMGIFKIDGCDQMWCTQCHTAFSFRTGQIEKKIHNPHYYDWLRQNSANGEIPREQADVPGGCEQQALNDGTVTRIEHAFGKHINRQEYYAAKEGSEIHSFYKKINSAAKYFTGLCREMVHMTEVIMPVYRVNQDHLNQNKRIEYMRNRVNEAEFKAYVQKIDKKHAKNTEILDVLQMVVTANTDIINRAIREIDISGYNEEYINNIKTEIYNLRSYANECFVDICKAYSCKPPALNEKFEIEGRKKRGRGWNEDRPLRNFMY